MKYYKDCSGLPLKLFCEISTTGNIYLLLIDHDHQLLDIEQSNELADTWYYIIKEYANLDSDRSVINSLQKEDQYKQLKAEYLRDQAIFAYLSLVPDDVDMIEKARSYGYKIEPNDQNTIIRAKARSGHLMTRMQIIEKTFEWIQDKEPINFDEIMAFLSANLKFVVPDDITVKRFLAYKKIIKSKEK